MMMLSYTILVCGLVYSGVYTTDGTGYELYFTDGSSYEFSPCSDLDILSTSLCPQNESEVKKKCDCKSLCAKKKPVLECKSIANSIPVTDFPHDECSNDESLAGCSNRQDPNWNVSGSFVLPGAQCLTDQNNTAAGVVRCCKIPGIQLPDNNRTASLMDLLSCNTKDILGETRGTAICSQGETMTACSGDDIFHEQAWIEERNGTDTCVLDAVVTEVTHVKGYVSCCRYK